MNLQRIRKELNRSQKEVAKDLYINSNTLCNYEKGNTEPPIQVLITLANYYNCTVDYLIGRENENLLTKYYAEKKELLKIAEQLNKDNLLRLVIYATGLLDGQKR